ncbi:AAA family ATPase [bacterium]|nr:AAA family ATPase [bacterium]
MLKIKSIKFIDDPVFKNKEFDFTTRSNDVASTIIIVGENGSGKTRLLNILEQLTDFIFTSETVLIQKVIGQNKPFILKDEIDKSNNFFLNAKGYEIEYQYEYTKSEKEFIEGNPQLLDNKNEHEIISSKLGNCFYFKLKILTNYYTNSNSEANYNILIQNIKFYDSEHKLIEDKQLENKILMRFRVSIPNFNNFNDPFLFGALFKFTHYTFYFDTLAELVINHPIYKLHISKLINEKDELNKYIATKEENSNINNKISFDIDTKSFDEIFHRINTSYEEILLKNYYDEFDVNKIEYPFNEIKLHLHKLNNYADAMNEFFKNTSKNKKYLMIDKIQDNKIYFKKDNKYFHYSKLSSGEKKILDESIFLLKILKNDFTNYKYPNFVQGNTIYFIDEIELGFHPL